MSLVNLQKKIGVTADGAFGPGTLKAAAAYYKLSPNRAAFFRFRPGTKDLLIRPPRWQRFSDLIFGKLELF